MCCDRRACRIFVDLCRFIFAHKGGASLRMAAKGSEKVGVFLFIIFLWLPFWGPLLSGFSFGNVGLLAFAAENNGSIAGPEIFGLSGWALFNMLFLAYFDFYDCDP